MKDFFNKKDIVKAAYIIVGAVIYAFGMNIFIVPMGLYSSGLMGLAQILRTLAEQYLGVNFGFDISGVLSFVLNIPLMILVYKTVGKSFIIKSAFCVAMQSVFLSLVPVTEIIDDTLTSCIIGGILCGFGIGITFQNGGSSGGVDIIGLYLAKKSSYSVGTISLMVNAVVFAGAFVILQDIE